MLDAMQQVGERCRGIVDVDEHIADAEIARLNDAGVRGVRINVSPVKAQSSSLAAELLPRIETLAPVALKSAGIWISCCRAG